jgi:hypothetical protein
MEALINCLPAILRAANDSPEVVEAAALAAWKHAAGESLRDHAVPLRLLDRTLIVAVADKEWKKQLTPMLGELLFRVNRLLGRPLVDYIELQVNSAMAMKNPTRTRTSQNEVPLEIWSAANSIGDARLRQIFLRTALAQTARLEGDKDKSKTDA